MKHYREIVEGIAWCISCAFDMRDNHFHTFGQWTLRAIVRFFALCHSTWNFSFCIGDEQADLLVYKNHYALICGVCFWARQDWSDSLVGLLEIELHKHQIDIDSDDLLTRLLKQKWLTENDEDDEDDNEYDPGETEEELLQLQEKHDEEKDGKDKLK